MEVSEVVVEEEGEAEEATVVEAEVDTKPHGKIPIPKEDKLKNTKEMTNP